MNNAIFNILNTLEEHGFVAFIIGGFVRDYLLGRESFDVDITTNARPKDIVKIFKSYKITICKYGNVTLDIGAYHVEITTFRKDCIYVDNRRPEKVIYVDTLEEDVLRRDFTINAICMDKNEKIIDILDGKKDLSKKLIRVIGNTNIKIREDALRIMRAVRFSCILNFKLDNSLKKAIIDNRGLIKDLSYERKKDELTRIFASDNKKYGVKLIKELHLVDVLELHNIDYVLRTNDITTIYATVFSSDYPYTKNEKDLIKQINELMNKELNNDNLYKYGCYVLSSVCDIKKLNKRKYIKKYDALPIKDRSEILIKVDEICEILNIEPSSLIKDIYDDLEKKILNKELLNNKQDIKDYLLKKL